jgi:hypothetical protein
MSRIRPLTKKKNYRTGYYEYRCNPDFKYLSFDNLTRYYGENRKSKDRMRNYYISKSDTGLYEFFAKELDCISKFYESEKRLVKNRFRRNPVTKEEIHRLNVYKHRMHAICSILANEFCKVNPESGNVKLNEMLKDKLIKIDFDELGPRRKGLLGIMGYEYNGSNWVYNEELKKKFQTAINYCHSNKYCIRGSSLSDIPLDFVKYIKQVREAIYWPIDKILKPIDSAIKTKKNRN